MSASFTAGWPAFQRQARRTRILLVGNDELLGDGEPPTDDPGR